MHRLIETQKTDRHDNSVGKPVRKAKPVGPATRAWLAHLRLYREMIATF